MSRLTPDLLYILYDAQCPLYAMEMNRLMRLDSNNRIQLVDIHSDEFAVRFPSVSKDQAMSILHGFYQGQKLIALEVTVKAWTLVGRGLWVAPLKWPVIKPLSHWIYLRFAKHRYRISSFCQRYLGIGKSNIQTCSTGVCRSEPSKTDTNQTDHRSQ